MTRFARAKGSKASNERTEEEATSWAEMKHQMEAKKNEAEHEKNRRAADVVRNENYKKFLEERESKTANGWAEFPTQSSITDKVKMNVAKMNVAKMNVAKMRKSDVVEEAEGIKKKTKRSIGDVEEEVGVKTKKIRGVVEGVQKMESFNGKVKKQKNRDTKIGRSDTNVSENISSGEKKIGGVEKVISKKKKGIPGKKTIKDTVEIGKSGNASVDKKKGRIGKGKDGEKFVKVGKGKKGKKVVELVKKSPEEMTEEELTIYKKKKDKKKRQVERRKMFRAEKREAVLLEKAEAAKNGETNTPKNEQKPKKVKKPKTNANDHKRRKENSQVETMHINGKEVKIAYFDGFPIKQEDGERLKQLRKEMISKGLPKSAVQHAMKLERRRAEKALTREKKNVCFNCRKSGHNLSECPDLADANGVDSVADGICFKCGSTEHTHFECKVVKGDQYRYASCFICKEQGHISRQCPDNARGLYPKGGACKLCGDVTHLKKDCPKYMAEQEAKNIGLDTIGGDDIEGLGEEVGSKPKIVARTSKVVKF